MRANPARRHWRAGKTKRTQTRWPENWRSSVPGGVHERQKWQVGTGRNKERSNPTRHARSGSRSMGGIEIGDGPFTRLL